MAVARASSDPRDRLVVEVLARTGIRAGELVDLAADAVVQIGADHWLRIPLGKLRNDRYVPLHPQLVDLLADWTADQPRAHPRPPPAGRRSPRPAEPTHHRPDHPPGRPRRRRSRRAPTPAAAHPGHPGDQPRHAARSDRRAARPPQNGDDPHLRAHRQPRRRRRIRRRQRQDRRTLRPTTSNCPPTTKPPAWPDSAAKPHARMLGNGLCTRPVELDCRMESACETCAYFRTSVQFLPILTRQRDHADEHGQTRPRRPVRRPHPTRRNRRRSTDDA